MGTNYLIIKSNGKHVGAVTKDHAFAFLYENGICTIHIACAGEKQYPMTQADFDEFVAQL